MERADPLRISSAASEASEGDWLSAEQDRQDEEDEEDQVPDAAAVVAPAAAAADDAAAPAAPAAGEADEGGPEEAATTPRSGSLLTRLSDATGAPPADDGASEAELSATAASVESLLTPDGGRNDAAWYELGDSVVGTKHGRRLLGEQLTSGRADKVLAPAAFDRLSELLSRGITIAHDLADYAAAVVFMNMLNTFYRAAAETAEEAAGEIEASGDPFDQPEPTADAGTEATADKLLMSKTARVLELPIWGDEAFWQGAMWQLLALEHEKFQGMLEAMRSMSDESSAVEAATIEQNIAFGAVSALARQMVDFQGLDTAAVRKFVIDVFKSGSVFTGRDHLDSLMSIIEEKALVIQRRPKQEEVAVLKVLGERDMALAPDTPEFRRELAAKQKRVEAFGAVIQKMTALNAAYASSHKGLGEICDLIDSDLKEQLGGASVDYSGKFREIQATYERLSAAVTTNVNQAMQRYYGEHVNPVKADRKEFDRASDDLEQAAVRFLALKSDTAPAVLALAESELTMQKERFDLGRFDLQCDLSDVLEYEKSFWEFHLAKLVDAHGECSLKQRVVIKELKEPMMAMTGRREEMAVLQQQRHAEKSARRAVIEKSTLKFANKEEPQLISGFLYKQSFDLSGTKGTGVMASITGKEWQKRWFILHADGVLWYYRTPEEDDACNAPIDMNQVTLVCDIELQTSGLFKKRNAEAAEKQFIFHFGGRVGNLKADSKDEKVRWLKAMRTLGVSVRSEALFDGFAQDVSDDDSSDDDISAGRTRSVSSSSPHILKASPNLSPLGSNPGQPDVAPLQLDPEFEFERPKITEAASMIAQDLLTCLHGIATDMGLDKAKTKEAFNIIIFSIKVIVESPTEPKYRTLRLSNKVFATKLGWSKQAREFLKVLKFVERDEGQVLTMEDDYPDMARLRIAYFMLIFACLDSGLNWDSMNHIDFAGVTENELVSIRPYSLPIDEGGGSRLDGFLFTSSGVLKKNLKHWVVLTGTKLVLFEKWQNMVEDKPTESIDLTLADVTPLHGTPGPLRHMRLGFRIDTPVQKRVFQCVNLQELEQWMVALSRCTLFCKEPDARLEHQPKAAGEDGEYYQDENGNWVTNGGDSD